MILVADPMHISVVRSSASLQKNMSLEASLGSPLLCPQCMVV